MPAIRTSSILNVTVDWSHLDQMLPLLFNCWIVSLSSTSICRMGIFHIYKADSQTWLPLCSWLTDLLKSHPISHCLESTVKPLVFCVVKNPTISCRMEFGSFFFGDLRSNPKNAVGQVTDIAKVDSAQSLHICLNLGPNLLKPTFWYLCQESMLTLKEFHL